MTRYTEQLYPTELDEGDRIDPKLVARHPDQLGDPIRRATDPHEEEYPPTVLVTVTEIYRYDDVHSAILVDPETGTMVRASRHDSQQAWTRKEADWTVREVGTDIRVVDADVRKRPDSEKDETEMEYMETWVDVLFNDPAAGYFDYSDERKLEGRTVHLRGFDGREGFATIELVDE